jgi:hypothetical protein
MANTALRNRTTDLEENQTQLSESEVVCDQLEQLGYEQVLCKNFSENEKQIQVPTDKLGEKDSTTDQNPHIETTPNNTASANVELQEILANILSTLQADKLEMMALLKKVLRPSLHLPSIRPRHSLCCSADQLS